MRVIAGSARGTNLKTIEGMATRPTVDRVKEALFSSIQFKLRGARCLDAFAGSGALGIEALSRGAGHVTFVDQAQNCCQIIQANLQKTRLSDRARVLSGDVQHLLKQFGPEPFDLVFLDPPYAKGLCHQMLIALSQAQLVHSQSIVVCEHDDTDQFDENYGLLVRAKSRKYGNTYLTTFEGQ